jgi:hypothetical protein
MSHPQSTITQDEYDALRVMLAARDEQIKWLQIHLANMIEVMHRWVVDKEIEPTDLETILIIGARAVLPKRDRDD